MYLSRLVISGFKSYTEPVHVDFGPQIAVIIGSNGVGKSNALDAIVWGLGENDPLTLRVDATSDLLFGGSKIAPAANEAVAELTFDWDDKSITVSRCLKRTGEESFSVAGKPVGTLDEYCSELESLGMLQGRQNLVRQEELTDFFVKTSDQRKSYIRRFVTGDDDFELICKAFSQYLDDLIPGSSGRILDMNNGGIDLEVVFPDKGPKKGLLLSGGERAVTSLALKLSLFDRRPSPMYLLDEVEPSLDWTRNHNMQNLLKRISKERQLIMITHLQSTIQMANTVHGVRIRPDGSSWLKFHFLMDERLFKIYKCC